ncbi:MAG: transporter suffix domain-containing protein [Planctomycetota bacterium]
MNDAPQPIVNGKRRSKWMTLTGVALILLSGACFFALPAVPLMPLSTAQKGVLGGALFIGVQAFWWIGVALIGPTAIQQFQKWFRRRK